MNPPTHPSATLSEPPPAPALLPFPSGHKRNGTVAHLPKAARDKINHWLDQGHTYPQIIRDLGGEAKDLKPNHLSQWRKGGYQDYLREQDWRAELRSLRESASDLAELCTGHQFQETLIQLALTEIFRALKAGTVTSDSPNYIRLFNALARLNREALLLRKYNDLCAKAQAAELPRLDPNRELAEKERDMLWAGVQRAFGFKPDRQIGPTLPELYARPLAAQQSSAAVPPAHPDLAPATPEPHPEVPSPQSVPATAAEVTPVSEAPSSIQHPVSSIQHPASSIQHPVSSNPLPEEHCPRCRTPLPPRLTNGERPTELCPVMRCAARLRPPSAPIEYCSHCETLLPDLLPNGHRLASTCPKCAKPLPQPPNPSPP